MVKRWFKRFLLLIVFTALIGAVSGVYLLYWMGEQWYSPYIKQTQVLHLKSGASPYSVIGQLSPDEEPSTFVWLKLWFKLYPEKANIKQGSYQLLQGESLDTVFQKLVEGKEYYYKMTLVEGETYKQWLKRLERGHFHNKKAIKQLDEAQLLAQWGSQYSRIEGLLLPETYSYTPNDSATEFLTQAYNAMQRALAERWDNRAQGLPLKTPYEALILASIVEKESGVAHERPRIASVFVNRLRKNMRLQTDPTVIYGMGERYKGNIRRKDLREATPYNTYVINGLPPTPIAMPSIESIDAVLHPENTRYLYFVATGKNGEHYFSKTLKEHNRAVRKYILKR